VSVPESELWLPLVDEPIGAIVAEIQQSDPEVGRLVESPTRILAFRTFAYLRVGLLLGQLLMENEVAPYDGSKTWVDQLMSEPEHRRRIAEEVRRVAAEISAEERLRADEPLGPGEEERARFREFARRRLA
jgi:hypothetical protein